MKKLTALLLALTMALSLAACGNSTKTETPAVEVTPSAEGAPAALSGTVATDGSTSMEKVIGGLGEMFMKLNSGVTFTYNPTGSSAGISAVQEGRCDIGLSSRALKTEEIESGLTETVLAYDGIAVIVNPENTVAGLDVETIAKLFTGEVINWSELGGADAEIVLVGREAGSGTRGGFEEMVDVKDRCIYRQELTSTGDVITAVSQNPGAIGYASVASIKNTVKALAVNGVIPSKETILDGSYAIQRPFVLVTKNGTPLSTAAQAFFDYAMSSEAHELITAAGIVPASS